MKTFKGTLFLHFVVVLSAGQRIPKRQASKCCNYENSNCKVNIHVCLFYRVFLPLQRSDFSGELQIGMQINKSTHIVLYRMTNVQLCLIPQWEASVWLPKNARTIQEQPMATAHLVKILYKMLSYQSKLWPFIYIYRIWSVLYVHTFDLWGNSQAKLYLHSKWRISINYNNVANLHLHLFQDW